MGCITKESVEVTLLAVTRQESMTRESEKILTLVNTTTTRKFVNV
jgi:hypothetical protein